MHHELFQPQPANTRIMQVSYKVYLMIYCKSDKDDEWDIIKKTEGKILLKKNVNNVLKLKACKKIVLLFILFLYILEE